MSQYMVMKEMVEESGISRFTLQLRLADGTLHGMQATPRGTWHVHRDCFAAFMAGGACVHRTAARLAD